MRYFFWLIGVLSALSLYGQSANETYYLHPEFLIGKTMEANDFFPQTNLQTGLHINIGHYNFNPKKDWAVNLNYPKTGITLGISDFGNVEKIGRAYSIIPFMEYPISDKWGVYVGMGGSFMDTLFDEEENPFNRAITTQLNWTFKSFAYFDILQKTKSSWRLGLGYIHHSNGHSRLPNQGLNSFLASVSGEFRLKPEMITALEKPEKRRTSQIYFSSRFGLGQNVLSEKFNDKKGVYTVTVSGGKIINKTFKFGAGFYYRFYQHYYDYIKSDDRVIVNQYPQFKERPFRNATNFGIFGTSELLLGHVGFEFTLGFNIHKPAYQIDWKLNEGFEFVNDMGETIEVLGELDWYYELKRAISSRLGLNFYLFNTQNAPKQNVFLGIHINGNLGQADFNDISLGYVYCLDLKKRE